MRRETIRGTDPRLPAIIERLRAGAILTKESAALGYNHNGALRRALREFMGAAEYARLMEGRVGAPSRRRPSVPKPGATRAGGKVARQPGTLEGVGNRRSVIGENT